MDDDELANRLKKLGADLLEGGRREHEYRMLLWCLFLDEQSLTDDMLESGVLVDEQDKE